MKDKKPTRINIVIGTVAELIKMMPIILELEKRKIKYRLISTGQNRITSSDVYKEVFGSKKTDIDFNSKDIQQTIIGLFFWFVETLFLGIKKTKKILNKKGGQVFIVHGDTVSTLIGSIVGKSIGAEVVHIESGLRSFNWFSPFPEEITRSIVSRIATYHFCPNSWSVNNLKSVGGVKFNTLENTLLDSYRYALSKKVTSKIVNNKEKFFIVVFHRQENLMNNSLIENIANLVIKQSKKIKCIFVLHPNTENVLNRLGILTRLEEYNNIIICRKIPYFEFQNLLTRCEFIITDGGSNQEECSYIGVPTLILRKHTERIEGLGKNIILSTEPVEILNFFSGYKKYKCLPVYKNIKPSHYIINQIQKNI